MAFLRLSIVQSFVQCLITSSELFENVEWLLCHFKILLKWEQSNLEAEVNFFISACIECTRIPTGLMQDITVIEKARL